MLDDKQPYDPTRKIQSPAWDSKLNGIGWSAYLADLNHRGLAIPPYAAPARNTCYRGFPPTITFVGTLEPFYQETCDYVKSSQEGKYRGCF